MAFLRGWGFVAVLLAAASWLSPGEARAFPAEPLSLDEGKDAHSKRFQVLGDLVLFAGKLEGDTKADIMLSPIFEMRLQLAENWILDAAWGFSYVKFVTGRGDDNPQSNNPFRAGNPWVGVNYQGVKGQFSYRFGVGVALPVASLPDDITTPDQVAAAAAYALAAATRGNTSYWLWDPHSISVIFPLFFERRKPSGFLWGANFSTGIMIACCGSRSARNNNQRNDAVVQMGAMMGYQAMKWLRVGSQFNVVILPKIPANQKTQVSLEPYLRFGSDDGFTSVSLVINLDNPWGFSFDKEQVWGLRIGGGAAF